MRYPLQLEGFEGQTVEVQPSGLLAGPKLLVNGRPAGPGLRRGHVVLRRNDGREVIAIWKPQLLGLDVPRVQVDGKLLDVVPPLKWYVWVWCGLPILLIFIGGALGALAGFVAFALNTRIFRTALPGLAKFGLTLLVSLLGAVAYAATATLLYQFLAQTL